MPLILVVDDELPARELLTSYLTPAGYGTIMASSGDEALEKARGFQPSAITLDVLMPGKSGWDTLRQLKNDPLTYSIPIIIVSVTDEEKMGFALGAAEYLIKPVSKQALLAAIAKYVEPRSGEAIRVLVVDDEDEPLELVKAILESAGYGALLAKSGKDALETLSQIRVDAIVLDLLMPEMDGFEALQRIKNEPRLRDIPVFVLTAKDLTKDDIEVLSREATAWLQKGASWKDTLLAEIQRAVGRRSSP